MLMNNVKFEPENPGEYYKAEARRILEDLHGCAVPASDISRYARELEKADKKQSDIDAWKEQRKIYAATNRRGKPGPKRTKITTLVID